MQKLLMVIAGAILIIGGIIWWNKRGDSVLSVGTGEKKLSVVVTFYPLEYFARRVGGDTIEVKGIVPSGAEPHEYEPTPQNILSVYRADVFLVNGAGLDPWAEKIRPELEDRGVAVVQLSEKAELLPGTSEEEEEKHIGEEGNMYDPHFWLDPIIAQTEVRAIRDTFILRDPAHKEVYTRNAEAFLQELFVLDQDYRKALAMCRLDTIVTTHGAFAYLARRYGFGTIALSGLSPESEPSPKRLVEIAGIVRKKGIRYVFFETLVHPKVAETLADETGTETLVFNPIEGLTDEEQAKKEDYLGLMRKNLENLQTALECRK